jgi:hypothetical protein
MPSTAVDPGIARVIKAIGEGVTASDSIASLVLKILNRVNSLETIARQSNRRLDLLEKIPRSSWTTLAPATPKPMTGIDVATGAPVRIEPTIHRPVGRPKGKRDSTKRRPRNALFHQEDVLLDRGFDEL